MAILIFGVVMGSLFLSFQSLLFEPAGVRQMLYREEMARIALDRMVSDLRAVYVARPPQYRPPGIDDPPHPHRLVGAVDFVAGREFGRLQFASLAHLPLQNSQRKGISQIVYYVQADRDGAYVLRRADHLEPYPGAEELDNDPILCKNIGSLVFQFMDGDGDRYDIWDSDAEAFAHAMPEAVSVRLQLAGEDAPGVFETRIHLPLQRRMRG